MADLTRNGFVDFDDLAILLANWNQDVAATLGNFVDAETTPVNFDDLAILLAAWTGPETAGAPEPRLVASPEHESDPPSAERHRAGREHFDRLGRDEATHHTPSRRRSALRRLQATAVDEALAAEGEAGVESGRLRWARRRMSERMGASPR